MMRVLHLEAGRHLYGGAQQVFYILQSLKNSPVEYFLACPEDSDIAQAAREVAQVLPIKMSGDLDVGLISRVVRLIREHRIDLLHVQSRRGADLFGLLAARKAGIAAVVSRRVDNSEPGWFARWKYHKYDRVITISEGIRQVLLSEGVRSEHVQTIRSAVDTQKFQPDSLGPQRVKETFNLKREDVVIGVVAQLIERKGHLVLLEALPDILKVHPNTKVIFFGKGAMEQTLRNKVLELELEPSVQFAGFRTDMEKMLPGLDMVVHPAFKEGLGVSLLQASACAVPVVAAEAGGIPEAVRNGTNGLLVEPGNTQELKDAILKLLDNPEQRIQFGRNGFDLMHQEFSIDVMAQANEQLYLELLS